MWEVESSGVEVMSKMWGVSEDVWCIVGNDCSRGEVEVSTVRAEEAVA